MSARYVVLSVIAVLLVIVTLLARRAPPIEQEVDFPLLTLSLQSSSREIATPGTELPPAGADATGTERSVPDPVGNAAAPAGPADGQVAEQSDEQVRPEPSAVPDATARVEGSGARLAPGGERLAAPSRVEAKAVSLSEIVIRWVAPRGGLDVVYEVRRGETVLSRGPATSLTDRELRPGQQYCYTVRAFDGWGRESAAAGPACATDGGPPTQPQRLEVTAASDKKVDLRWIDSTDDAGVVGYDVRREGAEAPLFVTAPNASVGGLRPAVEYCFSVAAVDLVGNRSAPTPRACVTTPDLTPPTPPHVAVMLRPPTSMVVAWDGATDDVGVVGYEVLRDGRLIAEVGGTSLTQSDLRVGVRYCFSVRALDAAGHRSSPGGPTCAELPDEEPPTTPGDAIAVGSSSTRIEAGWQASRDNVAVVGYELQRDGKVVSSSLALRVSEAGLRPETEYCYTVKAVDRAGNRSPPAGPFCARTNAVGGVSAPTSVRAVSIATGGVSIAWERSETEGVVYRVYGRGKRKTDRPAVVGTTRNAAFTDSGVPVGVPRCYGVAAVDATGRESQRSLEICAVGAESAQVGQTESKPAAAAN